VIAAIENCIRLSASRHATSLGVSDTSERLIHKDLNFHPYKTHTVHTVNDSNHVKPNITCPQIKKLLEGKE